MDEQGKDKSHLKFQESGNTTFKFSEIVKEVTNDVQEAHVKKGKKTVTVYSVTNEFAEQEKLFGGKPK